MISSDGWWDDNTDKLIHELIKKIEWWKNVNIAICVSAGEKNSKRMRGPHEINLL